MEKTTGVFEEIQHIFVQAYGVKLHTAVAGPQDGPLVVLLHGFPEFWYSWRYQIAPLAQAGYRVVVPDQRGYNLSEKKPPFDLFTLAQDVIGLVEALGHDQMYLAGHDFGAAVAWIIASQYPQQVKRLAILNVPHPATMAAALRLGNRRQVLKSWYIAFFQVPRLPEWLLSRDDYAAMRRALQSSSRQGTFSQADLELYRAAWAQPGALAAMLGWYRALLRPGFLAQRRLAARIQVPTRILWGVHDMALQVELAEHSLDWVDQGRLVRFTEATHWVHEEFPAAINRHLLEHFSAE